MADTFTLLKYLAQGVLTKSNDQQKLYVLVTESGVRIVELELPKNAARNIVDLLPEKVLNACAEQKIDLQAIQERLEASGYVAQEIVEMSYGNRHCKVWIG